MRAVPIACVLLACLLCGCSSKADIDAFEANWIKRIEADIPAGTDASVFRAWFDRQGFKAQTSTQTKGALEVWLGTVQAKEWYCDKWSIRLTAKLTPDGKTSSYDFDAAGTCL